MYDFTAEALRNFELFARNPYHGRFVSIGVTPDDRHIIQKWGIEGRSDSSRNRVVVEGDNGRVSTDVVDMSKVKNPETDLENIIYPGMAENFERYVVSNGKQTTDILRSHSSHCLPNVLENWKYEKDPSNTPRISASYMELEPCFEFAILRRSRFDIEDCERDYWQRNMIAPGYGYYLRTYEGDGEPLPTYYGGLELLPFVSNDPEEILNIYWQSMNPINRVSLVVKAINKESGDSTVFLKNQYQKVATPAQ